MKKHNKTAVVAVNMLLILTVVFCMTVVLQVMNRGYASIGGYSMFRVVTGSMEPTISVGALLVSKETPIGEIGIGDVVTFRTKEQAIYGETVTHRVVGRFYGQDGTLFLETRGDANAVSDGHLVSEENLIGKVVWYTGKENVLSKFSSMLMTRNGFFIFVLFPIIIFASLIMKDSVKSIRKEINQMKREQDEYDALVERLKREILEELLQDVETKDAGDIHGS